MLVDLPHEILGNRLLLLEYPLLSLLNLCYARYACAPRDIDVWEFFSVVQESGLLEFAERFFFPKLVPTRAGCSLVNDSPRRPSGVDTGYE